MNKASEILKNLSPTMGEAQARAIAMNAIKDKLAEDDLGQPPAIDDDVISQVIKSLAEAGVKPKTGEVAVQVSKTAASAEKADDIDAVVAAIQGTVEGVSQKVDEIGVYLNKSFGILAQAIEVLAKGMSAVDKRVIDAGGSVVELKKSFDARQASRALTGATAVPNLQDQAATAEAKAAENPEVRDRVALQGMIQVEIQKAAALEQSSPGSQKARLKVLSEGSLMLTRPIPAKTIAQHCNLQLPQVSG